MNLQRILSETFVASAEYHEVLGSTNDRARRCAAEGLPLPRLITADRQTAGRGRGANRWWTGPGGLAMSLLLPPDALPRDVGQSVLVSLVGAVAVVDVLRPLVEQSLGGTLGLDWPNDVMLGGDKLAGILVEALPGRAHVVGIGINTNNTAADAPVELREKLVTLRDVTGATCDHVELLVALLRRLEHGLQQLVATPQEVARHADELCLQRGQMLTIRTGREDITGRCHGIAPDGALLLDTPEGPRACYSGVVQ